MPVARCSVRLYRNMLATDLLHLLVALVILQKAEQNYKLLQSKAFYPAQTEPLPCQVCINPFTQQPHCHPAICIY